MAHGFLTGFLELLGVHFFQLRSLGAETLNTLPVEF
jgi:hypothetical protein